MDRLPGLPITANVGSHKQQGLGLTREAGLEQLVVFLHPNVVVRVILVEQGILELVAEVRDGPIQILRGGLRCGRALELGFSGHLLADADPGADHARIVAHAGFIEPCEIVRIGEFTNCRLGEVDLAVVLVAVLAPKIAFDLGARLLLAVVPGDVTLDLRLDVSVVKVLGLLLVQAVDVRPLAEGLLRILVVLEVLRQIGAFELVFVWRLGASGCRVPAVPAFLVVVVDGNRDLLAAEQLLEI
jgi:hypothetical protein